MKFYTIILFISLAATLACESIVDVKVNETEPYLVVDAWLEHSPGEQIVRLTTTQPYYDNTFAQGVTNAEVRITDSSGTPYPFDHQNNGNYVFTSADTFGTVGVTYHLEVLWEGNTYTSSTVLPRKVTIDSLVFNDDDPEESEFDYYAEFFARDPDGVGDAFWLKAWKNGKYLNQPSEIYTFDDVSFSNDNGGGIPFIFPIRILPNSLEQDINGNNLPLYTLGESFEVINDEISDFYGSKAIVEDNQLRIIHDETQRPNPLEGGIEYIPLDSAPFYLKQVTSGGITTTSVEKTPDSLYLELHAITPDAYFFLERLRQETDRPSGFGALFSTPPSDLPTNIICDDPEVPVVGFFNITNMSNIGRKVTEESIRRDYEVD